MSGSVSYDEESGRCAYEAYRQVMARESDTPESLPEWADLPSTIRNAWIAAAEAVEKRTAERATQF